MERKQRPNRFPPVLIVDDEGSMSYALTRAIEKIRLNAIVANSANEALRYLKTQRCHYLLICSQPDAASYAALMSQVEQLSYSLPVVLLGEDDIDLRANIRHQASTAGVTLHCFPKPIPLGVIRVLLADQRARDAGLPVAHVWGGMSSRSAYESHIVDLRKLATERSRLKGRL